MRTNGVGGAEQEAGTRERKRIEERRRVAVRRQQKLGFAIIGREGRTGSHGSHVVIIYLVYIIPCTIKYEVAVVYAKAPGIFVLFALLIVRVLPHCHYRS